MDQTQLQSLLRSIAISSGSPIGPITPQERNEAFTNLEQFKKYEGRITACIDLLNRDRHYLTINSPVNSTVDVTTATKLYAMSVIKQFLKTGYMGLSDLDRVGLRNSVISAAQQLTNSSGLPESEDRMLGMKIASLVSDIAVRDFPQRWTTLISDLFAPIEQGGIWGCSSDNPVGAIIGYKMGLECLKLIIEDCTDSDFNSKINSSRRNDVLTGLNEVSSQILPRIFALLGEQYSIVSSTTKTLHEMENYLISNGRTVMQMSAEERQQYELQKNTQDRAGKLVADCLVTLEKFCRSMPLEWMLNDKSGNDFVAAFLHLLREDVASINVLSVACLEALFLRKVDFNPWFRLISSLPQASSEANQVTQQECLYKSGGSGGNFLVEELPFHRALSRMFAHLISAHISHITTEKEIIQGGGPKFQALSSFLRLLVQMLAHPSGRICSEQINTWIALLRDPQIANTNILTPFIPEVLSSYITHMIRVRWEDVEDQSHPLTALIEASWDDKNEYDTWLCDLRSKTTQLFRFISNNEPEIAASAIQTKVLNLLSTHGNGEPRDHLDPITKCLTTLSEANIQFEGIHQPLENILQGFPSWSLENDKSAGSANPYSKRSKIRSAVRFSLSQLANAIVSWSPTDSWLRLRRAGMLESLKYYWKHDPQTLPTGVNALLFYLSAKDEWKNENSVPTSALDSSETLSGETIALRKKSGFALVSVAKHVPDLLVPWLNQLSERANALLSSNDLLPTNRMNLYEFLTCVATAVDDPLARSNFISQVLSNALNGIETIEVKEAIASTEGLMTALGISQASSNPASVTNAENVNRVTENYDRLFSSINQLLSVGRRCYQAAKKRPSGGLPLQNFDATTSSDINTADQQNFPDEGPVSIADLAFDDPFIPLWPRILPTIIRVLDATLRLWRPEYQAVLMKNPIQRYAYAISDDEAYLARKQGNNGGVFGEGGTAGSVVSGWNRRDSNLAPKWSGWFNELKYTSFQLLGLCADQRALYAPEISQLFPQLVSVVCDPLNLCSMEHRHLTLFLKQFIENLILSCPATLYQTHLSPFLKPLFEHIQYRLQYSWSPILESITNTNQQTNSVSISALSTSECENAATLASRGGEEWFRTFYVRGGLFVGDLDSITSEAAVEKVRVEVTRTFCDVMQTAWALKGEWALVLANQAKEEQAIKRNDPSKLVSGPKTRLSETTGGRLNADGTPRLNNQIAIEARQTFRLHTMSNFLLLDDEQVAGPLVLTLIQCLNYPDQYTCRRATRICHRIVETVVSFDRYANLLGNLMFPIVVKAIVMEPKWMVGIEWDFIALLRDIYCRMVLGQTLLPGGQGPGLQQPRDENNPLAFEQSKNVVNPLQGGGILCVPNEIPRRVMAGLPGVEMEAVNNLDQIMSTKRAAKDQKDALRDLLRVAAEQVKSTEGESNNGAGGGLLGRAVEEESLLNQKTLCSMVPNIPEKLVTSSQVMKQEAEKHRQVGPDVLGGGGLSDIFR